MARPKKITNALTYLNVKKCKVRANDMTRPPRPSFVRLLNMLNAIRQMAPFDTLNGEEVLLLDALIVQWHERDNIMVSEVMSDARFGSQPTVYRRVMALRDKGLICLRADGTDKRVKFVEPSRLARDYMESISEGIAAVGQSPRTT
jgi:DNA-binding transcriptional ArsR family regulator